MTADARDQLGTRERGGVRRPRPPRPPPPSVYGMPQPTFTLAPQYESHDVEPRLYQRWMDAGIFTARADSAKPPYVIMIPPPNVTGVLHMGHGLNNTVQDVLIRCARMRGREALWLPGHRPRRDRDAERGGAAARQGGQDPLRPRARGVRRAGVGRSCARRAPPSSTSSRRSAAPATGSHRFTLDPDLPRAVREVFVRLWEEGLIYRGHRVIHWCPRCHTSLSDEEAEFTRRRRRALPHPLPRRRRPGAHHRRDHAARDDAGRRRGGGAPGRRAPSRLRRQARPAPDRRRGDPHHRRRARRAGVRHRLREDHAGARRERLRGGQRHDLADAAGDAPRGGDGRRRARTGAGGRVPARCSGWTASRPARRSSQTQGGRAPREDRAASARRAPLLPLRHRGRAAAQRPVVRADGAARGAGAPAYRAGEVRFIPERWDDEYEHWMEGIRDWNISRQLWWGHRIPVWYCDACGTSKAHREDPRRCPEVRRRRCAGRGRARHLVLLVAVAVLHARLAGRDARPRAFYPDRRPRHRARRSCSSGWRG